MQAMRILGEQFVLGRNIEAALKRGAGMVRAGIARRAISFDMLGEGARTNADAERYAEKLCASDRRRRRQPRGFWAACV